MFIWSPYFFSIFSPVFGVLECWEPWRWANGRNHSLSSSNSRMVWRCAVRENTRCSALSILYLPKVCNKSATAWRSEFRTSSNPLFFPNYWTILIEGLCWSNLDSSMPPTCVLIFPCNMRSIQLKLVFAYGFPSKFEDKINSKFKLFLYGDYGATWDHMVIYSSAKHVASIIYQQIILVVPFRKIIGVTFSACWCAEFRAEFPSPCDFRGYLYLIPFGLLAACV